MMKSILGPLILSGLLMADFVRDDVKEVVNDTTTYLIWQDDNASKSVTKTWQEAIDYCENMHLAGHEDWRLPNFNELYSIGDKNKLGPTIKDAFENVSTNSYFSSTTYVGDTDIAWTVNYYGENYDTAMEYKRNYYGYVRCVRDGQ